MMAVFVDISFLYFKSNLFPLNLQGILKVVSFSADSSEINYLQFLTL